MSFKNNAVPYGTGRRANLRLKLGPQSIPTKAREPITPSRGKVRIQLPSTKENRMIACESQLEQKFVLHAELSPYVQRIYEQPISIYFDYFGTQRKYTPYFKIKCHDGEVFFVEVKPFDKLMDPDLLSSFRLIHDYFSRRNSNFIVVTDKELVHQDRLRNLNFLRAHLRRKIEESDLSLVGEYLQNHNGMLAGDLTKLLGSAATVFSLLAHGHLVCNLDRPINFGTKLKLPPENHHETRYFNYRVGPDFK